MPNFKLGEGIRGQMRAECNRLTARRVQHALGNFPITVEELQAALTTKEDLALVQNVKAAGYHVQQTRQITVLLSPTYLPGLDRRFTVRLHMPSEMYLPGKALERSAASNKFERDHDDALRLDNLPEDRRHALNKWAVRALKDKRLEKIVDDTTYQLVEQCKTTAHIMANCAYLSTLVNDHARDARFWRQRFASAPKNLSKWKFGPVWEARWRKYINACESFLVSANIMCIYQHPPGAIQAQVDAIEENASV